MYLTNILHVSMCVYCNRSQMTSQPVKNQKVQHRPKSSEWLLFFTSCDIFCDLLQYTHTGKCKLFVLYNKNSNGLFKDIGHEKQKSADVIWREFDAICVSCIHAYQWKCIEVTLLYILYKWATDLYRTTDPYCIVS